MEINDDEKDALFCLVAVVIHLGNVEYASGDNGRARITNPELVTGIAKVIQLKCILSPSLFPC